MDAQGQKQQLVTDADSPVQSHRALSEIENPQGTKRAAQSEDPRLAERSAVTPVY
jgi:hypothetical protein